MKLDIDGVPSLDAIEWKIGFLNSNVKVKRKVHIFKEVRESEGWGMLWVTTVTFCGRKGGGVSDWTIGNIAEDLDKVVCKACLSRWRKLIGE